MEAVDEERLSSRSDVHASAFEYADVLSQGSLIRAAEKKDLPTLKRLVRQGRAVNANDNRGYTALHVAVIQEQLDMIDYLITETDIIVDHRDHTGETALFKSMHCVSNEPALKLLRAGADVNIASNTFTTPLHEAVQKKQEVAHLLVERGADLNAQEALADFTPLHTAVEMNSFAMVCTLLYYAADVTVRDVFHQTAFMLALDKNVNKEIQELLLEYEAEVNLVTSDGFSHLLLAMNWQNPLALQLIERGADINYRKGTKNVINFLFMYRDDDVFERIWNMITPSLLEEMTTNIHFLFHTEVPWKLWNSILSSNKAGVLIRKHPNIISRMIRNCSDIEEDQLYPLICICLMYGATVKYKDFYLLYNYGCNKVAKLLLHMGISAPTTNDITLPYFICSVSRVRRQGCVTCLAETSGTERDINPKLFEYISVFFVMCNECASDFGVEVVVPSLKEFARETTRRAIAERFKTRNTLMFYTIVQNLAIPGSLKELIGYEIPV